MQAGAINCACEVGILIHMPLRFSKVQMSSAFPSIMPNVSASAMDEADSWSAVKVVRSRVTPLYVSWLSDNSGKGISGLCLGALSGTSMYLLGLRVGGVIGAAGGAVAGGDVAGGGIFSGLLDTIGLGVPDKVKVKHLKKMLTSHPPTLRTMLSTNGRWTTKAGGKGATGDV